MNCLRIGPATAAVRALPGYPPASSARADAQALLPSRPARSRCQRTPGTSAATGRPLVTSRSPQLAATWLLSAAREVAAPRNRADRPERRVTRDGRPASRSRPERYRSDLARESPTRLTNRRDRKSTRLNSSHPSISYAVFCLKKKKKNHY